MFKTRFTQLAKLNKQKADKIELDIAKVLSGIKFIEKKMKSTLRDIADIEKPKSGKFSDMNVATETFNKLLAYKNELKFRSDSLKEELCELQNIHKKAMLEYEKIKYLEEKELEKIFKMIKAKEQKELDEAAVMLYSNERGNR